MSEDGYCRPITDEQVRNWERQYDAADRRAPSQPSPPLVNVHLAVELATGLDSVRDHEYRGKTYRLRATPYDVAVRLLAWSQALERFRSADELVDHLTEIRAAYAEILRLLGTLVEGKPKGNPFADATQVEVSQLLTFALDPGTDFRLAPDPSGKPAPRYDTTYHLMAYRQAFGAMPATWRAYCAGITCLRRQGAEAALSAFTAAAMAQNTDKASLDQWINAHRREAGQV